MGANSKNLYSFVFVISIALTLGACTTTPSSTSLGLTMPLYGNWCGPGHPEPGTSPPTLDYVDAACMHHDQCNDDKGVLNCECDQAFRDELERGFQQHGPPKSQDDFTRGFFSDLEAGIDLVDASLDLRHCDGRDVPTWIARRGMIDTGEERTFYGVGMSGIADPKQRRDFAIQAARKDLATVLNQYTEHLASRVLSESSSPDSSDTTGKEINPKSFKHHLTAAAERTLDKAITANFQDDPTRHRARARMKVGLKQFLEELKIQTDQSHAPRSLLDRTKEAEEELEKELRKR